MGCDVYSYAVLGVCFSKERVETREIVRGCECSAELGLKVKFCPECGKKAWRTNVKTIKAFEDKSSIEDYTMVTIEDMIYIGPMASTQNVLEGAPGVRADAEKLDLAQLRAGLKELVCTKYRLLTSGEFDAGFGLHAVALVSC